MASPTDTFFNWNLFLPQKSPFSLLTQGVSSTNDLSALFIWLIILLFSFMSLWLLWRLLQAWYLLAALQALLQQADSTQLASQRRELRQIAEENPKLARLWLEFDASWVESQDGSRLYQTQDAALFFNTHTLAHGIVGNRLLMAMPGMLTAFGILGTFVGLQIGLSTLDLSDPQQLNTSIVPLIQGAAVAFATSVWGTVASVAFNFLEKSVEQNLSRRVNHLQQQANDLFRRHLPEQTLLNIERASQESENALKGLAEQIGERMQEVMLEVPQQIQNSIEASMTPAIDKLVSAAESLAERQGSSNQEALTQLIENFIDKVSASGETSREGMENASAQLADSIANWGTTMEQLLGRLDNRATDIDAQVGHLLEQGKTLREESNVSQQALADVAGEMKSGSALLTQATSNLQKLGDSLAQGAKLLGETHMNVAKLAHESAQRQQQSSESLEKIAQTLDQANDGLMVSSHALKDSAETAKAGFDGINDAQKEFLENLKKTLTQLRKQVGQMMSDYATDVEEQTRNRMEQWNAHTQEFSKGMVAAVNAMSEILGEIDSVLAQRKK